MPFYFGDSASPLFGVYDPPRVRSSRGIVLCPPVAREYLLAYPTVRLLARKLAEAGWAAMRFDYFGTGDSAGELDQASRERWLRDVGAAIGELKDVSQVTSVSLGGMRLGAALAAMAAAARRDVSKLVLWDPVFDGRAYLAGIGLKASSNADAEAQGVVFSNELRQGIESISLAQFRAPLPPTLVICTSQESDGYAPLMESLAAAGVDAALAHVPDVQAWREEWGRGGIGMPVGAVNHVISWLEAA